jgi:hypothetical protein
MENSIDSLSKRAIWLARGMELRLEKAQFLEGLLPNIIYQQENRKR